MLSPDPEVSGLLPEAQRGGGAVARPGPAGQQVENGLAGVGSLAEGNRRACWDLDPDLLEEVLSYLPLKDRCETMLVNRQWHKTVRKAASRWRKVEVVKQWPLAGGGAGEGGDTGTGTGTVSEVASDMIYEVLTTAQAIRFSRLFVDQHAHVEAVMSVVRLNLRVLELEESSVRPVFLPVLLSNCPRLVSFAIRGEPRGKSPIQICHPAPGNPLPQMFHNPISHRRLPQPHGSLYRGCRYQR